MQSYTLSKFTENFLEHQGLSNFRLIFKPAFVQTNPRRSKRENTKIEASDPRQAMYLAGSRTVGELLGLFYKLAPETHDWISGPRSYRPSLIDDQGDPVSLKISLESARRLPEERLDVCKAKLMNTLSRALDDAEVLLDEKTISRLLKQTIKDRYGS